MNLKSKKIRSSYWNWVVEHVLNICMYINAVPNSIMLTYIYVMIFITYFFKNEIVYSLWVSTHHTHQWKILGAREQYLAPPTSFLWWEISNTSCNFPPTMFLLVEKYIIVATRYVIMLPNFTGLVRGAVTKFPELWYSTVMVGHMTTLT